MVARSVSWLPGLALLAAHIAVAFGLCTFIFWLYFEAGVRWTPDPVVPQIQGFLTAVGQSTTALIFVPAGVLAERQKRGGLQVAIFWPLIFAFLPFLLPSIVSWLLGATLALIIGTILLVRMPPKVP